MADDDIIDLAPAGAQGRTTDHGRTAKDRRAEPGPIDVGQELVDTEISPPIKESEPADGGKKPVVREEPRHELGGKKWTGSGPVPGKMVWAVALALVLGSVAGLAVINKLGDQLSARARQLGMTTAVGALGVGLVVASARLRRGERIEITAFDRGIVYSAGGRTRAVRWTDVVSVTEKRFVPRGSGGQPLGARHTIRVACVDGTDHRFEVGGIEGSEGLSACIHQGTLPLLMPRVVAAVAAGRPVVFGRLTLASHGLVYGKETLTWGKRAGVDLVNGILVVRRKGGDESWFAEDCGKTPNVQVLLNLIKSRYLTPGPTANRNWAAEDSRFSLLDVYIPSTRS